MQLFVRQIQDIKGISSGICQARAGGLLGVYQTPASRRRSTQLVLGAKTCMSLFACIPAHLGTHLRR